MVHYIGDSTAIKKGPHENVTKKANAPIFIASKKSLVVEMKEKLLAQNPSKCYKEADNVLRGRDLKQAQNFKYVIIIIVKNIKIK